MSGIYIIQGELSLVSMAMRRNTRWSGHMQFHDDYHIPLITSFSKLKEVLNNIDNLNGFEPNVYLAPFLEVIRSEETSGLITGLALSSINKFLAYGLIDLSLPGVTMAIENISDAVTHARFIGTDPGSDEVVLMKILQVLRTLLLSSVGELLSDDAICEMMQSCFRICFESRLTELLRKCAEQTLIDMVQILFQRLPHLRDDLVGHTRRLKMRSSGVLDNRRGRRKAKSKKQSAPGLSPSTTSKVGLSTTLDDFKRESSGESTTRCCKEDGTISGNQDELGVGAQGAGEDCQDNGASGVVKNEVVDAIKNLDFENGDREFSEYVDSVEDEHVKTVAEVVLESPTVEDVAGLQYEENTDAPDSEACSNLDVENLPAKYDLHRTASEPNLDPDDSFVTKHGVRFITNSESDRGPPPPYGVACVWEIFRFMISLISPHDPNNSDSMVNLGLTLLTVALECSAQNLGACLPVLQLIQEEACKHLYGLLTSLKLNIFSCSLRVAFLLFERLRHHLKFQLEVFVLRVVDVIVSDNHKVAYEHRELALDFIVQLLRVPSIPAELYLNYDCNMYSTNLFEEVTKLLSKNAFPVSGLYSTHVLSLDALLAVMEQLESRCGHRVPSNENAMPTAEELVARKTQKRALHSGTEQFNARPKKGIAMLQLQGLLIEPLVPDAIVKLLRENPRFDKKVIGEYISTKDNIDILDSYVRSFNFDSTRIDEALRMFLEAFRLPGEAPTISKIMEAFAAHWHDSAGRPFKDNDAAFTLCYSIIMLNVDQHNTNAKKQNIPMTTDQFKKNLKGCNGGGHFDPGMLDEIYLAVRNEEIVVPEEQHGQVRENYIWKSLLRRSHKDDCLYQHVTPGFYDYDLFLLVWGPTVAALSFVFDKSIDEGLVLRAITGFKRCAKVAARYSLTDVFDNVIISLCKFTTLLTPPDNLSTIAIVFGSNPKALLAARTAFLLTHDHGDILREGWKNILDCLQNLYKARLLPATFQESEDFIDPSGTISLRKDDDRASSKQQDQSIFSSFYQYITLTPSDPNKVPSQEDQEYAEMAQACIEECAPEKLVQESRFLRSESLNELVKMLTLASGSPDAYASLGTVYDEESAVFHLELLLKVVVQNRDRILSIWGLVRDHLYALLVNASEYSFLVERAVVALLKLAIRLLRKDEIASQVLHSLRIFLLIRPPILKKASRYVAFGVHELVRANAANIHSNQDWFTIFTLLEVAGANIRPPPLIVVHGNNAIEDSGDECQVGSDRGYGSDSDIYTEKEPRLTHSVSENDVGSASWLLIGDDDLNKAGHDDSVLSVGSDMGIPDYKSLIKCCESTSFVVRDAAHVTPCNFELCVHAIRVFIEALSRYNDSRRQRRDQKQGSRSIMKRGKSLQSLTDPKDSTDWKNQSLAIQLLDLMHTLHTNAGSIYKGWAEESAEVDSSPTGLWTKCWFPLLQGMARMCCDGWKQVRITALTYLQRGLLVVDLQSLRASQWECCFHKVLFPLLTKLAELPVTASEDVGGIEETRTRVVTLLSKVFLQHLTSLIALSTFSGLWLGVLDYMDKYQKLPGCDLLSEAVPELLKNMLLVMDTAGILSPDQSGVTLWFLTWDRLTPELPQLRTNLFPESKHEEMLAAQDALRAPKRSHGSSCSASSDKTVTDSGAASCADGSVADATSPHPHSHALATRRAECLQGYGSDRRLQNSVDGRVADVNIQSASTSAVCQSADDTASKCAPNCDENYCSGRVVSNEDSGLNTSTMKLESPPPEASVSGTTVMSPGASPVTGSTVTSPGASPVTGSTVMSPGASPVTGSTVMSPGASPVTGSTVTSPGASPVTGSTVTSPGASPVSGTTVTSPGAFPVIGSTVTSPGASPVSGTTVMSPGAFPVTGSTDVSSGSPASVSGSPDVPASDYDEPATRHVDDVLMGSPPVESPPLPSLLLTQDLMAARNVPVLSPSLGARNE